MSKFPLEEYHKNGLAVIENFWTEEEADELKNAGLQLCRDAPEKDRQVFGKHHNQSYFLDSANKLHYFYEKDALDDKGNLLVDKMMSINKLGHGIHLHNETFKKFTFNDRIKKVAREIGLKKPIVLQSMFIFKNRKIGGVVKHHQDATYLHSEPVDKITAFWIPTEDATVENGCLWYIKGSHKGELTNLFIRNPNAASDGELTIYAQPERSWPENLWTPCPVKKGSLVIFDGLTIHRSEPNFSDKSRYAYTFHVMDADGVQWSKENWLQLPEGEQFLELYNN